MNAKSMHIYKNVLQPFQGKENVDLDGVIHEFASLTGTHLGVAFGF